MQITILSNSVETATNNKGGTYQKLIVSYKNEQGKIEGRTLMDFTAKDVFKTLAAAQAGQVYNIGMVKEPGRDGKEYWNWKSAELSNGTTQATSSGSGSKPAATVSKSTYETPAERAQRQVFIVRQSSISSAIATLSVGSKTAPSADSVIELAKKFEAYVFDKDVVATNNNSEFKDVTNTDGFEDEIPF